MTQHDKNIPNKHLDQKLRKLSIWWQQQRHRGNLIILITDEYTLEGE